MTTDNTYDTMDENDFDAESQYAIKKQTVSDVKAFFGHSRFPHMFEYGSLDRLRDNPQIKELSEYIEYAKIENIEPDLGNLFFDRVLALTNLTEADVKRPVFGKKAKAKRLLTSNAVWVLSLIVVVAVAAIATSRSSATERANKSVHVLALGEHKTSSHLSISAKNIAEASRVVSAVFKSLDDRELNIRASIDIHRPFMSRLVMDDENGCSSNSDCFRFAAASPGEASKIAVAALASIGNQERAVSMLINISEPEPIPIGPVMRLE